MSEVIAGMIVLFGVINVMRMCVYFTLGNWYDFQHFFHIQKKRKRNRSPRIDIFVAAYNEEKTIIRCLESIYKTSYTNFQVIVANDGSTDETVKLVKKFRSDHMVSNLVIVSQKNGGKARVLNAAISSRALGQLVMTLDADSVLDVEALSNVVKYFDDKKVVAIASNVRILFIPTLLNLIQQVEYLLGYRLKKAYTVLNNDYIVGGIGAVFRRQQLKKVKFYDTDTITEDIDLTMKLIRSGNKDQRIVYAADVITRTEGVQSVSSLFRQRFRWKFGRFQTLWKNRMLFFHRSKNHSKFLTFLQLPFVIYSELTFLFDPILWVFILLLSVQYLDFASFQGMMAFLGFYMALTVIADEHLSKKEQAFFLFLSPLAWMFFLVISVVEYAGLLRCIWEWDGIVYASQRNQCGWEHVERVGIVD